VGVYLGERRINTRTSEGSGGVSCLHRTGQNSPAVPGTGVVGSELEVAPTAFWLWQAPLWLRHGSGRETPPRGCTSVRAH